MHSPGPHQTFGLGTLIGQHGSEAPARTSIWIDGRGVFAAVRLSFELAPGNDQDTRVFLLEVPREAVLSQAVVAGQPLDPAHLPSAQVALASSQFHEIEELLKEGKSELTAIAIPAGTEVTDISLEYLLSLDLLWHRGGLAFQTTLGTRAVEFSGRWDLTGLAGAGIRFSRGAQRCRVETLEGARYRWNEPLEVTTDEAAELDFSLDEKKAASVAVFSPSTGDTAGCAAVAVIAPVRAQLARDPVRLAFMVEAKNPQEALLIRQMVESLSEILRPGDELSLWLLGTDSPSCLLSWTSESGATDEILSKLLDPTVVGRAEDLWSNLASLGEQARCATHVVLATSGTDGHPQPGTLAKLPVFVFATGRAPHFTALESLAQRNGGALVPGTVDGLSMFAERLKVRLSPPLLSEFKLDGWSLGQLLPSGPTQVYSDQPTLVLGTHEGLLPKTVTLSGLSPSRQKLAQRVRVETLSDLDLSPLYKERRARWEADGEPTTFWSGSVVSACRVSHHSAVGRFFTERKEVLEASTASTLNLELFASPTLAISFEEPSDSLEGPPPSSSESELFQSEPFFSGPAGGPMVIFKETFGQDGIEPDLFEDSSELHSEMPESVESVESEESFEFPTGPPIIVQKESFEEASEELEPEEDRSSEPVDSEELAGQIAFEMPVEPRLGSWKGPKETPTLSLSLEPIEIGESRADSTSNEDWTSEWLEKFQGLEASQARAWLETCSLDHLGLAVSLLEPSAADSVLEFLSPLRRRAVMSQVAWGVHLESYEREHADRQLALSLTQALI